MSNTQKTRLTDSCIKLYNCLGKGKENALNGWQLAALSGLPERSVRKCIQYLTSCGYAVCNLEDGKGYYIPVDIEDIQASIKLTNSRIRALMRKKYGLNKALMKMLKETGNDAEKPNVDLI